MRFKSQAYHWLYSQSTHSSVRWGSCRFLNVYISFYACATSCSEFCIHGFMSRDSSKFCLPCLFCSTTGLKTDLFLQTPRRLEDTGKKKNLLNEMNTYLCVLEQRSHENSSALFSSRKKNVHHQDAVLKITRILAGWQNVNQSTLSPWRKMSGNNKGLL